MKLQIVPLEWVHYTWPKVVGFIEAAIVMSSAECTADHVLSYVINGQWTLVVAVDDAGDIHGAGTMYYVNQPTARVARISMAGGRFIIDEDTFAQVRAIAAANGATDIEAAVRASVARLLAPLGFAEKHRIVGVKI